MTEVRAKFIVDAVTKRADSNTYVTLVADAKSDNGDWSKYTPSGKIEMCITQQGACDAFQPGDTFDILFTKTNGN